MLNSIIYFEENCIKNFEELEDQFLREPTKFAEYIYGLTEELHRLGLMMIQEALEEMDQILQLEPCQRLTEDAEAEMLREAVKTS